MTELHDKDFKKSIEELHEKSKQSDENMRAIRESVKSINRYLAIMNFMFITAIIIMLVVDFIAAVLHLK